MPAKRSFTLALALLLVAAIPARAAAFPVITVIETSSGTASFNPSPFTAFDGYIYFSADDGTSGRELWRTNGTTLGTTRVADINSGPDSSDPSEFTVFDGHLYFSAHESFDDGPDTELWRTDGTELGTTRVANIGIGTNGSYPSEFTVFNGYLYFSADNGDDGDELWRTDGTELGTTQVKDINEDADYDSDPDDFTAFDGYLYFSADNGDDGDELWRTDGTEAGTTMVKEINDETDDGSDPSDFTAFDGYLYFSADDGMDGTELWRTDGTTLGTTRVTNINTSAGGSSDPYGFTALNGYLYFSADDGANGYELWRTDGTELGTTRVTNINTSAGGSSDPYNFIVLGDYLYFTATDGTNFNPRRIDGSGLTESAVIPGTNANTNCECEPFAALGGRLYMRIESVETGAEIAYLDEPTFGLPGTNRDGSVWSTVLVLLAAVTAVAGAGLRIRGVRRG
jgi:ELWxxDGT repeat protein